MCMILVFLAELLAGTFGFIYRVQIGDVIKNELKLGIAHKYSNSSKLVDVWDHIQLQVHPLTEQGAASFLAYTRVMFSGPHI